MPEVRHRFIIVTDIHLRATSPGRRTDPNYLDTQIAELRYVCQQASDLGCKYILVCGDIGDVPNWAPKVERRLMYTLKQYGLKLITTLGQHDVYKHNIAGYKENTSVSVLEEEQYCTVLHGGNFWEDNGVRIYGYGYGEDETSMLLKGKTVPTGDADCFKIGLVHASVGGYEAKGWQSIEAQNIKGLNCAFFGDIHPGFKPYKLPSGTVAASAGALARTGKNDYGRAPKYIELTVYDDHKFDLVYKEIPHLPDEELFDMSDVASKAQNISEGFRAAIARAAKAVEETPEVLIDRIGKAVNEDPSIIKLVIDNLEKE